MQNSARTARVTVSCDGKGMVSQAGAVLLWETLRVTGLGRGLSSGLSRWRAPRAVHDPGKIIADLAAAVALGGDCLADIAVLREQPGRLPRMRMMPSIAILRSEVSAPKTLVRVAPGAVMLVPPSDRAPKATGTSGHRRGLPGFRHLAALLVGAAY